MTSIRTSEFGQLYELLRAGQHHLKCLSLDCFDTILWRNVDQPVDVFYRLQNQPAFSELGFDAAQRRSSESDARKLSAVRRASHEVSLNDIFLTAFPGLDKPALDALARTELECEKEACFAYPPVLKLIEVAKEVGLKVIVVSDTYFSKGQLKDLLQHRLPEEVYADIDQVFCSNEHGRSKAGGLFQTVLGKLRLKPEQVLHIGDNQVADFEAPQALGLSAFHFQHYGQNVSQVLQMNSNAVTLLKPELRTDSAMPSPFHPVFAAAHEDESDSDVSMGYYAAGPLLYAFARYLCAHAEQAVAQSPRAKYLFLMRDGYLPQLAFNEVCARHAGRGFAVEVSRFASYACSFRSREDVDRYLARMGSDRIEPMAKQLLLSEKDTEDLVARGKKAANPLAMFCDQVRKPGMLKKIFRASAEYRERFYRYLENTIDLQPGDRLVFVDLGYTGTAQMCLQPVLEAERDVTVEGLYLLLANTPGWRGSKQGLIDSDLVSSSTISTLVPYVAALEMICTNNAGSVVGYTDEGEPQRKAADTSPEQHRRVEQVQAACLRFLQDAGRFYASAGDICDIHDLRLAAVGALGRMTFFPTAAEVQCMQGFYLDVNLATDLTVSLFDTQHALEGLRKMGLFHALIEKRMNIPTELRYHNLELSLALLVQHRYQQSFSLDDFSLKRETVSILLAKGGDTSLTEAKAFPGYDGYFSLLIPVGANEYDVGVQFGLRYEWVQLGSVVSLAVSDIFAKKDFDQDQRSSETDLGGRLHFDQIEQGSGGVLHCQSPSAFVLVQKPEGRPPASNMLYLISFRPLVEREQAGS